MDECPGSTPVLPVTFQRLRGNVPTEADLRRNQYISPNGNGPSVLYSENKLGRAESRVRMLSRSLQKIIKNNIRYHSRDRKLGDYVGTNTI